MMGAKRPVALWVISAFLLFTLVMILIGQTMAVFDYGFTVRLGLQESAEEVSEFGVQVNRAFGASDTFIYIPLIAASLIGLLSRKRWSLLTAAAVMGISAYWATTHIFMMFIFLKGVAGYNFDAGPGYLSIMSTYIIFGVWGLLYLIFKVDRLTG